ncbi:MAG: hypothetical protein QOH30_1663 [Baekduia sp.]|nr:hypothetical protein [Baekduia sp.]
MPAGRRTRAALGGSLLGLAVVAVVFVTALPDSPARPLCVFLAAIFVPGGAILTRLKVREPAALVGLAIALSLAIETAISLVLVWTKWFEPDALGIAVLAISVPLLATDLLRLRTYDAAESAVAVDVEQTGTEPEEAPRRRWTIAVVLVALAGILVTWAVSLPSIDLYHLDDYGLTRELPVAWYAALGCGALGAALVITLPRRPNGWLIAAFVAVVALILYGTLPLLAEQPHYAWVYKHIGVTRFITETGSADPSIDIYNRWPGMFALTAVLGSLAGRTNPINYAAWAELFFSISNMLLIAATVRTVTRDVRVAGGAALLFLLSNWVGQGYFSPQALGYLLSLAVIYVALRHLSPEGGRGGELVISLVSKVVRAPQLPQLPPIDARWRGGVAIVMVLVLDAVIVVSHQLTPYIVIFELLALTVLGPVRPFWLILGFVGVSVAYLLPNLDYVNNNFGLFTSFDPFNNAQHSSLYDLAPLKGKTFNAQAGRFLTFALWLSAAAGALVLARRGLARRALPLALLAAAPFAVVFGQNYGGEASLRVVLFTSPWCAALIAWWIASVERRVIRAAMLGLVSVAFAAGFVPAYFGAEEINTIPKGQIEASEYFYDHAARGTVLLLSGPNFPVRYGPTYRYFAGPQSDFDPNLLRVNRFRYRELGPADIPDVISLIHQYAPTGYMVFSTSQSEYAKVFQLTPPGALANLEAAVRRSPLFRIWYQNSDARIYQLVGSAPPSNAAPAAP